MYYYLLLLLSMFFWFSCYINFLISNFIRVYMLNLKFSWFYMYLYMLFLFVIFMLPLFMSSMPFVFILGGSLICMFYLSFISWSVGYLSGFSYLSRFHFNMSLVVLGLFLFDSFVVLLRPVTLTLRVFINISLGHFLIMFIHLSFYIWFTLIWALEMFVYLVQSFVFMTLTKSYTDFMS